MTGLLDEAMEGVIFKYPIGHCAVRVRGPLACFTRPEFKVERVSYEVLTPSAARGILEAVLWKPAIHWQVRRIALLAPVRFAQFKRNEVTHKVQIPMDMQHSPQSCIQDFFATDHRCQRNTLCLRDVDYMVEAEILMTPKAGAQDNPQKFARMLRRRLDSGKTYTQPYLGCREFPAIVEPYLGSPQPLVQESKDLGLMLHDIRYGSVRNVAVFFKAKLEKGVIDIPEWRFN